MVISHTPLQNRVNPFGDIIAVPDRGLFMGNRGILHDDHRQLVVRPNTTRVPWKTKAWIICRLDFNGRQRQVMALGRYTELFFLDEATALAAGHRPCAECRRENYNWFKSLWKVAHGDQPVDETLHSERTDHAGAKRTHRNTIDVLPDATFIRLEDSAWLICGDRLLKWSPGGYMEHQSRMQHVEVEVLTPPSMVAVLRLGYRPVLHPSAATFGA